jgi:tRNA pseudouridine65 synthase
MDVPPEVPVLFRDEGFVVVAKPAGLVVHRGYARERHVVMSIVRDALGCYVHPVHRLDRQTSGVLVLALDAETTRTLAASFERGEVRKRYLALVRGSLREPGFIDHPVPKDEDAERVPAQTEYTPVAGTDRYTLVEARPLTGRFHQLRRHFRHIDHPIVLDKKYGRGIFHDVARAHGLTRMALHACSLELPHPRNGTPLTVVCPLPSDLSEPFSRLGVVAPQGIEYPRVS